jgi:hypothetical protein
VFDAKTIYIHIPGTSPNVQERKKKIFRKGSMSYRRGRSRSPSSTRRPSPRRSRSRSRARSSIRDKVPNDDSTDPKFFVPYRCLIPPDAVGSIVGRNAVLLRSLVEETGVEVQVLRSEENPRALDDRIVVLNGPQKSKDDGLLWLLSKLREHFRKRSDESITFVAIVPSLAVPSIVGSRGAYVREMTNKSRAEINIGKDDIRGTSDTAVTLKGRSSHICEAMMLIHNVIQDLHLRGRLRAVDFAFCKIFTRYSDESKTQNERADVSEDFVSGIPVRLVVSSKEADYLTSREGITEVKSIERDCGCLVSVEEPICPPMTSSEEILIISGEEFKDKARAATLISRVLHRLNPNRISGVLMDSAISGYVIGNKGVGVNTISKASGSTLRLRRNSENTDRKSEPMNLMECSGDLESQCSGVRLLIGRIDSSVKQSNLTQNSKKPTYNTEPQQNAQQIHSLVVHLPGFNEDALLGIHKRSSCGVVRQTETLVHLNGTKRQISRAVEEILLLAPAQQNEDSLMADEDRHRRQPGDFSDDEVDYN